MLRRKVRGTVLPNSYEFRIPFRQCLPRGSTARGGVVSSTLTSVPSGRCTPGGSFIVLFFTVPVMLIVGKVPRSRSAAKPG